MTSAVKPCPFCTLPLERFAGSNDHAVGILDGFPVSPGHSLDIPKRHVASFFEVMTEERTARPALQDEAKATQGIEFTLIDWDGRLLRPM